jgi:hypothetical protein
MKTLLDCSPQKTNVFDILPDDCTKLIGYYCTESFHTLSQLQRTSQHFNKLLHDTMNVHDEKSPAYKAIKDNYNLCTKLLISYAKQIYKMEHGPLRIEKENHFYKFWQLHKYRRNNDLYLTLRKVNFTLQDKINLYAGHPHRKNRSQINLYQDFCRTRDVLLAEVILKENNNLSQLDNSAWNFNHFFISKKELLIKDFLLGTHGRGIDFYDSSGSTVLHLAVEWNNQEITELLLQNKATVDCKNKYHNTPLFLICMTFAKYSIRLIPLLIKYGAKLTSINNCHRTPLYVACQYSNHETVKILVENGANISEPFPKEPLIWYRMSIMGNPKNLLEYMQQRHEIYAETLNNLGYK